MFRLRAKGLPADPEYPHDLDKLGYYINLEDEVRNKKFPTDPYRYKVTKNDRHNIVYKEAFNECIRLEVLKRLDGLSIKPFYLPQLTTVQPKQKPCVPILMTPPEQLQKCQQIIIINNLTREDLGIWSYRVATNIGTIDAGSYCGFVKSVIDRCPDQENVPGFIFLNPSQPLYSYRAGKAMSATSWDAQPRASGVHDSARVHPLNYIGGNGSPREHLEFVFRNIISNTKFASPTAKLSCIGREDGATQMAEFFAANWYDYSSRTTGLALAQPATFDAGDKGFSTFLRERSMIWELSQHAIDTPLANADVQVKGSTPRRSSGEANWAECIIPSCLSAILDWFEVIGRTGPTYKNQRMEIPAEVIKEHENELEAQKPTGWEQEEEAVEVDAVDVVKEGEPWDMEAVKAALET